MSGISEVADAERLVRTTFSPEHFDGEEFQLTAISLKDLSDNGVSVDREQITPLEAVEGRLQAQAARLPESREVPVFSVFTAGAVRDISDDDGEKALVVNADQVDGNPGHALILSSKKRGRGALRGIRLKLIDLLKHGVTPKESIKFGKR